MTHTEIKQARSTLGLTVKQFGAMLDITDERAMRKHMANPSSATYKPPSARMVRLINAYLSGYRPDDWPKRTACMGYDNQGENT